VVVVRVLCFFFFLLKGGGRRLERDGFRFRFFFVSLSFQPQNSPPLLVNFFFPPSSMCWFSGIYRRSVVGSPNLVP